MKKFTVYFGDGSYLEVMAQDDNHATDMAQTALEDKPEWVEITDVEEGWGLGGKSEARSE